MPSNADHRPLAQRLAGYGCTDYIPLDKKLSLSSQVEYLDLLPTRTGHTSKLAAVAEHQGTALLYVVDSSTNPPNGHTSTAALRRQLANRSDPAWLGVMQPGSLEIFPIGFHETSDSSPVVSIEEGSEIAPFFFQSLVHGTFQEHRKPNGTDYVYHKIFDLLTQTTDEFVPPEGSGKIDAIKVLSMAGRVLFYRFLIDRRIILEDELSGPHGVCPGAKELKDAFSSPANAAQTSAWLDATFNGDFLSLIDESIPIDQRPLREKAYLEFYEGAESLVGRTLFKHLEAILRGWKAVGNSAFQPELDWGDLDFAHIPVGVLSQVYESFSHRADPRTARDTSVHYTPRTIARLMVDEAFAAVDSPAKATVLDSSCGAGIFLVLAFRRLVRERWLHDDKQPGTDAIQEVLYNQIRGFDISESALRLAALALYITAIELNASPRPPHALKFPRNLRSEVLYRFSRDENDKGAASFLLGSLGPAVPREFDNRFDIVIGNPPWTRLRDRKQEGKTERRRKKSESATEAINAEFTRIGRRVLERQGLTDIAKQYENPDKNPDLPFVWRSMEWCKEGGVIALAMPARLIGRTSGAGLQAWRAILSCVDVTGIINGANLRKTAVWNAVDVPFCLFFARNRLPRDGSRFQFAAPAFEPKLNGEGRFRIDYEASRAIDAHQIAAHPWLLKTLSVGTWLDVELMTSIQNAASDRLGQAWSKWDSDQLQTGEGFNRAPDSPQKCVDFLAKLPVFERPSTGFSIDYDSLRTYGELYGTNDDGNSAANMPRREVLYMPPLVIIPQSPGDNPEAARAFISDRALAFSKSNYGYSCAGHPHAETLAALIYLLSHSALFAYYCLMTSRRSGFDRQTFNKEEFDALPFPDIEGMSDLAKSKVQSLAKRLERDPVKPWHEVDAFIFDLYGLDRDGVQVARDTLFFAASYRKAGRKAFEPITIDVRRIFMGELRESLEPYFDVCGKHAWVQESAFQSGSWHEPWYFLSVSCKGVSGTVPANLIQSAMAVANARGCSRIIVQIPNKNGLLLGLLNQRRWWTITRARLCARHIIREHLGAFGLPEGP